MGQRQSVDLDALEVGCGSVTACLLLKGVFITDGTLILMMLTFKPNFKILNEARGTKRTFVQGVHVCVSKRS